jgi:hypothetical protein
MYANIFLVDKNTEHLIEKLQEQNARSGDIIENINESGYRTEGVSLFYKDTNQSMIVKLQHSHEDYGHVGDQFSLGPEYPVGYWTYAFERGKVINLSKNRNAKSRAYWHDYEENPEPLNIRNLTNVENSMYILNNGMYSIEYPWGNFHFAANKRNEILNSNVYFFYTDTGCKEKPTAIAL